MGKFKSILTCLGAGIAAGAGYFLYRKYVSRDGEQEKDSFTQGDGENDNEEDSRNVGQGGTAENGNVSVVSEEDSRVEADIPVTHSSSRPNRENQNETRTLPLLLSPRWRRYIFTRRHNSAIMYISLVLLLQSQKNKTSFFNGHGGFLR